MKRLVGLILTMLISLAIIYDLRTGTLPREEPESIEAASPAAVEDIAFFEKEITAGDTLISIVEEQLQSAIPVTIPEVISDFQQLNNGLPPEDMQMGETYKFPDYRDEQQ
ncbi:hypothetical protein J9303_09120 [Bacillaceae bacterium Marseille-Q3522]|nr:hypothetical protein [Bacillaceae bacterium Marseille-Q3522]